MKSNQPSILVVDDEQDFVDILTYEFEDDGWRVFKATNGVEALAVYEQDCPDVILTDVMMPHVSGLDLVRILRETDKTTPIIAFTAYEGNDDTLLRLGANKTLKKPMAIGDVIAEAKEMVQK